MTINNKSERNYRGKCLGWPVTSYGGAGILRHQKVTSSQWALQLSWWSTALVSQRSWVRIPFKAETVFSSGSNFTTAYVVCIIAMIMIMTSYLSPQFKYMIFHL